jgi:hypothetical protein
MSIEFGALLVSLSSILLAAVWRRVKSVVFRYILAAGFPLLISLLLYWLPGKVDAETKNWAPLFIVPWFIVGLVASLAATFFFSRIGAQQGAAGDAVHQNRGQRA